MSEFCDLCLNEDDLPVSECLSPNGEMKRWLCPKCQEFVAFREAMSPEELQREAESIRAYQEEMRRYGDTS